MKRRMVILAGLLALAAAPPADAQNNAAGQAIRAQAERRFAQQRRQQAQQQQRAAPGDWSARGVIHSVRGNTVNILTDQQQPWRLTLANGAEVTVKGEGGPEMVKPRSLVSFFANVNSEGEATEPITEVRLLARTRDFEPEARAVTPEEEQEIKDKESGEEPDARRRQARRRQARRPTPTRAVEDDPRGASEEEEAQDAERERGEAPVPSKRYYIKGVVRNVRGGKIVVEIDKHRMSGELAEEAKVKAAFDTLAAASRGDRIEVTGTAAPVGPRAQFGQAIAKTVKVTLTPPEDPSENRRAARRARRGGDQADEPRGRRQRIDGRRGR